jgi:hypothetical protein
MEKYKGLGEQALVIGWFADVLYLKGVLCFEELEAIQNASTIVDLSNIFEKMIGGEYNVYKRGEQRSSFGN